MSRGPGAVYMTWDAAVVQALGEQSVDLVAYLPDSLLAPLVERVDADGALDGVRVAREAEGVAALGGAWLGGRRGALVCQSSGLANCFNALGTHAVPSGLPFVGLVTRRGDLGEHNYAQVRPGYGMPQLLDTLGVRNRAVEDDDDVRSVVSMAADTAFATQEPYVLLLERSLTGGK